ncbi:MAG: DUF1844 domain-containing protein, partial [Gemmatimonadales bacterium]
DFSSLVAGIATSAVAVLAQVEQLLDSGKALDMESGEESEPLPADEVRKRVTDGLGGARQLIDTLGMLEEKTKGNLTGEELELLQSAVSELRFRYVSLSNRPVPQKKTEEEGKSA